EIRGWPPTATSAPGIGPPKASRTPPETIRPGSERTKSIRSVAPGFSDMRFVLRPGPNCEGAKPSPDAPNTHVPSGSEILYSPLSPLRTHELLGTGSSI